jgi:hypothetical protein
MGADMTPACAPACDLTPQRTKRIKQVVRAISNDDEDVCVLMEQLNYDRPADAKRRIIQCGLESQQDDRQITTLHIPGCPYPVRVAGGLSWGDPPSEAYTVLEHVARCPQLWEVLEEFAREDTVAANASSSRDQAVGLKLADSLTILEIRKEAGIALLGDGHGGTYELHTDECHALTFQHLVATCQQTLESLERNLAPGVLPETREALRDALTAVR